MVHLAVILLVTLLDQPHLLLLRLSEPTWIVGRGAPHGEVFVLELRWALGGLTYDAFALVK